MKKKIDVGKMKFSKLSKLSLRPLSIEEIFMHSLNFDLKETIKQAQAEKSGKKSNGKPKTKK